MRELAYRALRRLLVLQKVPEGERLREPQWAKELAVNRAALREAFARLEAEGLIRQGERTGYFVPALDQTDIDEIVFVRTVLECAAIDLVCADPPRAADTAGKLLELCTQFEQFADQRYSLGCGEADRRFHECLMDSAGNKRLALLYHRAPLPLIHSRIATKDKWSEQATLTAAEHRAIAAAIAEANASLAKRRLREHLHVRHLLPMSD